MTNKFLLLGLIATLPVFAQDTSLSLRDAVQMAMTKSHQAKLADQKVSTAQYSLQTSKMAQYPDLKVSGQYLRLTDADITMANSGGSDSGESGSGSRSQGKVNQLILGQANASMPLFSGFKIRNSVSSSENLYKAQIAETASAKEDVAMNVIGHYAALYKSQKAIELLRGSLKSSQQRVSDFKAQEQNGLIARNDLLKAQLQVSNIQLSLDAAIKDEKQINYELVTLLQLPEETHIVVSPDNVERDVITGAVNDENQAISNRKDMQAIGYRQQAGNDQVKVAKSNYFPALSLVGGYAYVDLNNLVRVENAMNFGVGLSYNLASLFKNKSEVKTAKSRVAEIEYQKAALTDQIKTQLHNARETFALAQKQHSVYEEAKTQADENFRIVKDKFDNGLADTTDLLDADVEDLSARINVAYSEAEIVLRYYQLLKAAGQLYESFNAEK